MVSPISYRVYSTYGTPHLMCVKKNISEVIQAIEDRIYKEDANYVIIQQDDELNEDYPFAFIYTIDQFEQFKNMYKPKEKRLEK